MFSLLNSILVWFMSRKTTFSNWVFPFVGLRDPFHTVTLQKCLKNMKVKIYEQLFLRNNSHWPCLHILSSNGTSQLDVLYVRTLGNIQENFLNEILFYYFTNKPPTILFLEIYKSFETTSKMLLLENCLSIYSWYMSLRLFKPVVMSFVLYMNLNHKDTTNS